MHTPEHKATYTHTAARDAHKKLLDLAQTRDGRRDQKHEEGMWEGIFMYSKTKLRQIEKRLQQLVYVGIRCHCTR